MADKHLSTPKEIWKVIPGYEGYEVSNQGRVRSYWRRIGIKGQFGHGVNYVMGVQPQKILSQHFVRGYPRVKIKQFSVNVHRLVLLAFVGPCPPGHECCHNDGIRSNPTLDNLRWGTHSENMKDKFKHGYSVKGTKHPGVKLSDEQVIEIRNLLAQGCLHRDIAETFNIGKTTVTAIHVGQNWAHLP